MKKVLLLFFLVGQFLTADCQSDLRTYKIEFDELTISFESKDIWSPDSLFDKKHQDSIEIDIGLAENFDNKKIKIVKKRSDIEEIKAVEYYKTSMSVGDDGAHLDMYDWKHYESDTFNLGIENDSFTTLKLSESQRNRFPNVTKEQILKVVEHEMRGQDNKFFKRALECSGANDYPCYVSLSQIALIITVRFGDSKLVQKTLVINVPMGD